MNWQRILKKRFQRNNKNNPRKKRGVESKKGKNILRNSNMEEELPKFASGQINIPFGRRLLNNYFQPLHYRDE